METDLSPNQTFHPKKSLPKVIKWAFALLVIGFTVWFIQAYVPGITWVSAPFLLLAIPVVFFLIVFIHEMGHILGGLLVGFRFLLLLVGPIRVWGTGRGLQFGLNTHIAMMGGLSACVPDLTFSRWRCLVYMAGGPLASLFTLLASLPLLVIAQNVSPALEFVAVLAVFISLPLFILTILPFKSSGYDTDGKLILSLLLNRPTALKRIQIMALQAESISGVRPRDMSTERIEQIRSQKTGSSLDAVIEWLAYSQDLDRGNIDLAGQRLQQVLALEASLPPGLRQAAYLEVAYFAAVHQQDAPRARTYLEKARGALAEKHTVLRAEGAVLLAEGRLAEARAKIEQALSLVDRSIDAGGAAADKEWLLAMLAEANKSQ